MPCVHDLFRSQAAIFSKSIAIIDSEVNCTITYEDLDKRSNQLANYLLKKNVTVENVIAVVIDRSIDIFIAILGILKAGAAYVPLDPEDPIDRLQYILSDCQAKYILTLPQYRSKFNDIPISKIIYIDKSSPFVLESHEPPFQEVSINNLAYILYTSGSTGNPKGVMVEHRSIENIAVNLSSLLALTPDDRVLQFSSLLWDTCGEEIYPTLISGACLVLRSKNMLDPISSFLKNCEDWGITILNIPTAFWHALTNCSFSESDFPPLLRTIIIGGEQPSIEKYREWEKVAPPNLHLINTYGLTEAGMVSTYFNLGSLKSDSFRIPIGKPIPNVEIYILDNELQPTVDGQNGCLFIGGKGVARGYLNLPNLNGNTFLKTALPNNAGTPVLCKTGDIVKKLPDGNLEFVGRIDHQVKIRGHRVEPEEIEATFLSNHDVQGCTVVFKDTVDGYKRTIACVISKSKSEATIPNLQNFIRKALPQYMQPISIMLVDEFPLTPHGKIDRKKLAEQEDYYPITTELTDNEKTTTETKISEIITKALGVVADKDNNFFDLGLDSLIAIQITLDIEKIFQTNAITIKQIFDNPTIRDLSSFVDKCSLNSLITHERNELTRVISGQEIPLSFNQQEWLLFNDPSLSMNYDLIFRLRGVVDLSKIEKSINKIIERHGIFRTVYKGQLSYGTQDVLTYEPSPMNFIDITDLPNTQQQDFLGNFYLKQQTHLFNRSSEKPIRYFIIRTHSTEYFLAIFIDHIAFDNWSSKIFVNELSSFYNELKLKRSISSKNLPLQYIDFSAWQARTYKGERMDKLLKFWEEQFSQHTLGFEFPVIASAIQSKNYYVQQETMILDQYLVAEIRQVSMLVHASLYVIFLTVFFLLLYYLTKQDDIIIHTHTANRSVAGSDVIIGDFAHSTFVRAQIQENMFLHDLIMRVQEKVLQVQLNSGVSTFLMAKFLNLDNIKQSMVGFELIDDSEFYQMNLTDIISDIVHPQEDALNTALLLTISTSRSGNTSVNMSFNPRLFCRESVKQLMEIYGQFLRLLTPPKNIEVKSLLRKIEG